MMQTVHYFYGYLHVVDHVGEEINVSVPSGGFGNLCAGALAREMGLPIKTLVVANNKNACLHRIFSQATFTKAELLDTASSAIDILIPFNFWRYLYFSVGKDPEKIKGWMEEFKTTGQVEFDQQTFNTYSKGFLSHSASDKETLEVISETYHDEGYLLDPHGAVSVRAADVLKEKLGNEKIICLATAHPAKFPETIKQAINSKILPKSATHHSIETAKSLCQKVHLCDHKHLEQALIHAMETNWDLGQNNES
jgi:threonine synthase